MTGEEYKIRRGILPPMRESPKSSPDGEPRIDQKPKNGVKAKPRQLEPIESFDEQKHQKRNRKLTEQSNRGNSIYKQWFCFLEIVNTFFFLKLEAVFYVKWRSPLL